MRLPCSGGSGEEDFDGLKAAVLVELLVEEADVRADAILAVPFEIQLLLQLLRLLARVLWGLPVLEGVTRFHLQVDEEELLLVTRVV